MTGPYRDMPSHGIAYDVWAGIVAPKVDENGDAYMPEHVSIGINAGPVFGALGLLAGVLRARETGEGCQLEIAQSDAAAAIDWLRSETWQGVRAARVGGHGQRRRQLRAPRAGHRRHGVGRALPVLRDHRRLHPLHGLGARVLEELLRRRRPRPTCSSAGPARSTATTRAATPSCARSCARSSRRARRPNGSRSGMEHNTPIAPSNTPKTIGDDPQFRDRMPWIPASSVGADMLPTPIKFVGETLPDAHDGADGRPAHRGGAARGARLGRQPHRGRTRRRRVRCRRQLTKETRQTDVRIVSLARDTTGSTRSYDEQQMTTRRARPGDSIARVLLVGALLVTITFGAAGVDAIAATGPASSAHHAAIVARDTRTGVTAVNPNRARGSAWVALLFAALISAAIAAYLLRTDRRSGCPRNHERFSIQLRGPPRLHVAH